MHCPAGGFTEYWGSLGTKKDEKEKGEHQRDLFPASRDSLKAFFSMVAEHRRKCPWPKQSPLLLTRPLSLPPPWASSVASVAWLSSAAVCRIRGALGQPHTVQPESDWQESCSCPTMVIHTFTPSDPFIQKQLCCSGTGSRAVNHRTWGEG